MNPIKRTKPRCRIALQRSLLYTTTAEKPYFKRFSGIEKAHRNSIKITVDLWRRRRDLNPRDTFAPYSLSRGAPSPLGYFSKGCCLYKKMWRRGWDSNPRALSDKRFSRPPRYDHFDTSPDRKLSCQARSIISQLCISVNCFSVLFLCLSQKNLQINR